MTELCHGTPPLTARTEPWMAELLADPEACAALVAEHGSPVNLLDFTPLARHVEELFRTGERHGVPVHVFVARKANKALGLVGAAEQAGAGVDVASFAELQQSLDAGLAPGDIIVSAAVKDHALLELAVSEGVTVSLDNLDELADLVAVSRETDTEAHVALRLAVSHPDIAPTRFGLTADLWRDQLEGLDPLVRIEGVHFHLNGYSAAERALALVEACALVDALRAAGHPVEFIDMGGGIPMSYLDDEAGWREFWRALADDDEGRLTWRGDRLGLTDPALDRPSPGVYPFWQRDVRGGWLDHVLTADVGDTTPAELLSARGLRLHCEPGRSVLDGCGMTLARVAFRKTTSDGIDLVGLQMNRTQMRSTSADVLLDPRWIRPSGATDAGPAREGFLVGAYCIEEELILRRRFTFPQGVARGDLVAFVNTAGYLMHILESPSHQLPLAHTVVRSASGWVRDGIDTLGPASP